MRARRGGDAETGGFLGAVGAGSRGFYKMPQLWRNSSGPSLTYYIHLCCVKPYENSSFSPWLKSTVYGI